MEKKGHIFLLRGVLIVGAVGCETLLRQNVESPNTTNETVKAPDAQTAQQTQNERLAKFVEGSSMLTSKRARK